MSQLVLAILCFSVHVLHSLQFVRSKKNGAIIIQKAPPEESIVFIHFFDRNFDVKWRTTEVTAANALFIFDEQIMQHVLLLLFKRFFASI
jgi:hypothetical protein